MSIMVANCAWRKDLRAIKKDVAKGEGVLVLLLAADFVAYGGGLLI